MATKKTNGKKRQSPSTERLLALALVRLKECVLAVERAQMNLDNLRATDAEQLQAELETALTDRKIAIEQSEKCLTDNGYGDLESIATRVAAINDQIQAALSLGDGKALALLGPALERAKKGLPPIAKAEKRTKPAATERKMKVSKAVKAILEAFDKEVLADAQGRVVASLKADETGKLCMVVADGAEWITVDPKDLQPLKDLSAKGPGTPAVEGKLSDATVQATSN